MYMYIYGNTLESTLSSYIHCTVAPTFFPPRPNFLPSLNPSASLHPQHLHLFLTLSSTPLPLSLTHSLTDPQEQIHQLTSKLHKAQVLTVQCMHYTVYKCKH